MPDITVTPRPAATIAAAGVPGAASLFFLSPRPGITVVAAGVPAAASLFVVAPRAACRCDRAIGASLSIFSQIIAAPTGSTLWAAKGGQLITIEPVLPSGGGGAVRIRHPSAGRKRRPDKAIDDEESILGAVILWTLENG